jgi:hypothetical protein
MDDMEKRTDLTRVLKNKQKSDTWSTFPWNTRSEKAQFLKIWRSSETV